MMLTICLSASRVAASSSLMLQRCISTGISSVKMGSYKLTSCNVMSNDYKHACDGGGLLHQRRTLTTSADNDGSNNEQEGLSTSEDGKTTTSDVDDKRTRIYPGGFTYEEYLEIRAHPMFQYELFELKEQLEKLHGIEKPWVDGAFEHKYYSRFLGGQSICTPRNGMTVKKFFSLISGPGPHRDLEQYAEKFKSWDHMFTIDKFGLKHDIGMPLRVRSYFRRWLELYRCGNEPRYIHYKSPKALERVKKVNNKKNHNNKVNTALRRAKVELKGKLKAKGIDCDLWW